MLFLRILSAIYFVTTYVIAVFFTGFPDAPHFSALAFSGIIALSCFLFLLIASNKVANHSFFEIILLIFLPPLIYLIFRPELSKDFWIFLGFFNYLVITGAGIFVLFVGPLLAKIKGSSNRDILKKINMGATHWQKVDLVGAAAIMLILLALSFIFSLDRALDSFTIVSKSEAFGFGSLIFGCFVFSVIRIFEASIFSKKKNQ
jgi:hypothetical protein